MSNRDTLDAIMNTLAEATVYFEALLDRLVKARDRRGVFVAAYVEITRGVGARIREGAFRDSAWVERYLVEFAKLYRSALEAFDAGGACPKAWRIAFGAAANGESSVLQDLVLGMNAHINGDLPLALAAAGLGPDRAIRRADHLAVNAILQAHADNVQNAVAGIYSPVLRALDFATGRLDELVAGFAIAKARESAWLKAALLTDVPAFVREPLAKLLEGEVALLARGILAPTALNPALRRALRAVDEQECWRKLFG